MQALVSVRTRNKSPPSGAVHGVLLVDKPGQMTSHDVVGHVRRAFGTRRVGHAGTLDPMATGLLVILLGEATKLSSVLTTDRKTYVARVQFGVGTDTLDKEGKITRKVDLPTDFLAKQDLPGALAYEINRRLQIPPQVSAIKVDGQRAYARARQGKTTELAPRDVTVHDLTLLGLEGTSVDLSLTVSKGYYVRSLARDLGDALGVPAHLTSLRRLQSGPFDVAQASPIPLSGEEPLMPLGQATRLALPTLEVNEEGAARLIQGKQIGATHLAAGLPPPGDGPLLAAFLNQTLVALVRPCDHGEFRVQRGVNDPAAEDSPLPRSESDG